VSASLFDTLRAAKRLKDLGFTETQAEGVAEMLREAREVDLSQLATKTDLQLLEQRVTIKFGVMLGGAVVLLGGFLKLFPGAHP